MKPSLESSPAPNLEQKVRKRLAMLQKVIYNYMIKSGKLPDFFLDRMPKTLPMAALEGTRVYPDRDSMLVDLPRQARVAEVGTHLGDWAQKILDTADPIRLHLFDLNTQRIRPEVVADSRVTIHQGDSSRGLARLPDHFFDWIYIDGDHSYEGVKRDIEQALVKVKPDGLLVFNDYCLWSHLESIPYGVMAAVNELCCEGWVMKAIALSPWGYYDVVIKRAEQA